MAATINTNTDGSGNRFRTSAKRALLSAILITSIGAGTVLSFNSDGNPYNSIDNSGGNNVQGNAIAYNARAQDTQAQIIASGTGTYNGFHNNDFSFVTSPADNGPQPTQGQFRITCNWSHVGNDDPIIFPNQPGRAHAHLFFGNTQTNADTTFDQFDTGSPDDIFNNGGSTCQGNVLNRSAYWIPAIYGGPEGPGRQFVMPDNILLYYKSHQPQDVQIFPAGVQLLVGNVNPGGSVNSSFSPATESLHWGCYSAPNGQTLSASWQTTIPTNCNEVSSACPNGGCPIQATIQFPQCMETDDGLSTGNPVRTSPDFLSHTLQINQNFTCPASHPYRIPQISYLIRWNQPAGSQAQQDAEVSQWRLSCDQGWQGTSVSTPGGCLHGDWFGAWNEDTNQAWIDGCFIPNPRNCSGGQTGSGNGTSRRLVGVSNLGDTTNSGYVNDPCPDCTPIIN